MMLLPLAAVRNLCLFLFLSQVADLRAAFRRTWDRLSEQYGELADTNYEVLQLWALVEYSQLNSPINGAAIWGEILSEFIKSRDFC